MPMPIRASAIFILLAGCFSLTTACNRVVDATSQLPLAASPTASPAASPSDNSASQPLIAISPVAAPDRYVQAIERAKAAFVLSQSAQSRDDWKLVADRWQQAIALMMAVPQSSPDRARAQQKIIEYQRNLAFAQRQATRSTALANPDGVIVFSPQPAPAPISSAATQRASQPAGRTFSAPIVRRAGNTPVVNVTFNGNQTFEMIVDTGASGTLITRSMATTLGVVPVAQASVDTASARNVKVPLGYVDSISVGSVTSQRLLVAIAGPELSLGLLGHDFFRQYDVTIRENEVEFRER